MSNPVPQPSKWVPTARETHAAHSLDNIPNLVEIQLNSFQWFVDRGLLELFHNFSPIEDFTGQLELVLKNFKLDREKYTVEECRDRDMTYERPIKAQVILRTPSGDEQETEVYLGDLPIMTERGTFVINGVDRVVVSQLARSPGVYFNDNIDFSGRILYTATLIPSEGAWLEIETDANDVMWVRIGQTRKFALTTLLRALGGFDHAVNYGYEHVPLAELEGRRIAQRIVDKSTGEDSLPRARPSTRPSSRRSRRCSATPTIRPRSRASKSWSSRPPSARPPKS